MLVEQLKSIGMTEVTMDDNGYVMATLPSNNDKAAPTIGFMAHLDTATDFTGKDAGQAALRPPLAWASSPSLCRFAAVRNVIIEIIKRFGQRA